MTNPNVAHDAQTWSDRLKRACEARQAGLVELAEQALRDCPHEGRILVQAALAALLEENPERCLRYLKRYGKYYIHDQRSHLLRALALAQQGRLAPAAELLKQQGISFYYDASRWFPGSPALLPWLRESINKIQLQRRSTAKTSKAPAKPKAKGRTAKSKFQPPVARGEAKPATEAVPELPRTPAHIPVRFEFANRETIRLTDGRGDPVWFRLRNEFAHLGLLQGFDELLCLPLLHRVETFWYQVETVRKVLKIFRGRVLLADEVGLGKTVEAGMALKEYLLRGMVEKFLILTPASLVGQWREEMASKFDIHCASNYDPLFKDDPEAFWSQPRVIASIATARRKEHFARLARQQFDLVIVDEAHHLKSRTTLNYKLVDSLQKRFLLLLSATPVQNNLVELYNLLTLLKPGIFKTEKEFRAAYMTPGKPRVPANQERMRDLMRDAMIRNTRALVDVRLPSRHATTLRLNPGDEERTCYRQLDTLIRETHTEAPTQHRLALHHMLSAAGSSPEAARGSIERFAKKLAEQHRSAWTQLHERYAKIRMGVKESALLELLQRNPEEKKIVFVHHRETLNHLDGLLAERNLSFARFEGSLSGPDKDAVITRFRDEVPVLLSTESGGEGRNIQFCNTLINFDMPWNPMVIEQRTGRIHRIGQHREVFIFNLVAQGTLEDQVLRILDEKINMFELVVGEIDAILGELDEQQDFSELVFSAWVATTEEGRTSAFAELGERMAKAKSQYESVKTLDEELFSDDFATS